MRDAQGGAGAGPDERDGPGVAGGGAGGVLGAVVCVEEGQVEGAVEEGEGVWEDGGEGEGPGIAGAGAVGGRGS